MNQLNNMNQVKDKTIREIALSAPATTRVFEEFKIDYCCGGRKLFADACIDAGIDPEILADRLHTVLLLSADDAGVDHPEDMKPSVLIDYILAKHHIFTAAEVERLTGLMDKVVTRHGEHHPVLFELKSVFGELGESLIPHMRKEEMVLFPYIQELEAAHNADRPAPLPPFGTVQNPIRMLMAEHDADGERLEKMRKIAAGYTLPEGACPSFTALYAGLEDLERDLHRHIHLENNVLFPAAAELER